MGDFHDFGFNSSTEQEEHIDEEPNSEATSGTSDEEEETDHEEQGEGQGFEMSQEVGGITSLIALNQTYLDLIDRLISKVEHLLENNKEEQKKIQHFLKNKKGNDRAAAPVYRAVFLPPYFKDTYNMIPGLNDESREIKSRCSVNPLLKEERIWTKEELRLLKKSVIAQLMEIKNKEVVARRDFLREKIVKFRAEDQIEQLTKWKEELGAVMRRLNYLNSKDDDTELKSASFEDIDWARIAVREFKGSRTPLQLKMKWTYEQAPRWNNSAWTKAEDDALKRLAETPWQNWDFVASKIETKRTAFMYFERFHHLNKKISAKRPWTTREDEKLLSLVDRFTIDNTVSWKKIASHMPDRNRVQCETRYNRSLNPNLVHGRWTEEEDMLLIACVNKYGPHDWPRIAQSVPGRTDVQCRARWVDNLDYKRSKAPWSVDEDEAILVGIQVFGRSNFSSIAKLLPGRNTSAVKIRIRTFFRWKIIETRNKDKIGSTALGHVLDFNKARPEEALKRFNQVMEMSQKISSNQHGFSLAKRLGYGNYVVKNGESKSDYSAMKQQLTNNFGRWFISKNGRWTRLGKNPNEFGKAELDSVKVDLPTEKRRILEKFLKERAERQRQAQKRTLTEEEMIARRVEQSERISNLMDAVLIVEQKDIDMNNKKHPSARFDSLTSPFGNDKKKSKHTNHGQKLNASFSTLINDLAPRRYSLADRLTDEITYKITQLPTEERRGFILNLMCEMLTHQMGSDTQARLNALPKPILNVKILNYLQSILSKGAIEQAASSFDVLPDDDQSEIVDPCSLDDSNTTSTSLANNPESKLHQTLQNLVIPSNANCSVLLHYTNIIRPMLAKRAKTLFPILNDKLQPAESLETNGAFMDIQLSSEVTSDPSYQLLRERLMRLFLLPMLFKRAFESETVRKARISVREEHVGFKELQLSKLEDAGVNVNGTTFTKEGTVNLRNEEIIASLNESLQFKVYNPQLKKRLPISASTPDESQTRKRRQTQNTIVEQLPTTSQPIPSPIVTLPAPLLQPSSLSSNEAAQQPQIFLQPPGLTSYRPRKAYVTPGNSTQSVSVRDFILMTQMPAVNLDTPQSAKKKRTH